MPLPRAGEAGVERARAGQDEQADRVLQGRGWASDRTLATWDPERDPDSWVWPDTADDDQSHVPTLIHPEGEELVVELAHAIPGPRPTLRYATIADLLADIEAIEEFRLEDRWKRHSR